MILRTGFFQINPRTSTLQNNPSLQTVRHHARQTNFKGQKYFCFCWELDEDDVKLRGTLLKELQLVAVVEVSEFYKYRSILQTSGSTTVCREKIVVKVDSLRILRPKLPIGYYGK